MTRRAILGVAAVVLAPFACAKEEGPPTRGEARDFSAVCDKSNDGRRVAVEGYLRFPDSFHQKLSIVLRLYRSADFEGAPMGVQTPLGSQPNHVEYVGQKFN